MTSSESTFSFEPPTMTKYCIIFPISSPLARNYIVVNAETRELAEEYMNLIFNEAVLMEKFFPANMQPGSKLYETTIMLIRGEVRSI